ncbi:MAG TPA: MaoC family dehydratase [Aliidongia sp.]|uniref:MaoC family dehydratase n=1 Tax=Aliidongia sp. TaxID=1914230 RepID=UPI002DDD2E4D|nr:MaoC family dehydratase [Aliidongia sp.]HEV2678308.1 MaoC family dehydratase [Aliidongia sp.]
MIFTLPPEPIPRIAGLEELAVGQRFELGSVVLERADIIGFATDFDPQPFHLDDEAAASSMFGQLVASGIHTISAIFGLSVRTGILVGCNLGGSGMTDVKWLRPVRPGDVLSLDWTIVSITPSERRPDRGTVQIRYAVTNQDGQGMLTLVLYHIVARVPA